MPATTTTKHPHLPLTLRFTEADHVYTGVEDGRVYPSVTTIIKSAFIAFDAPAVAAKVVAKDASKGPVAKLIAEWDANRKAAADYGTRFHQNVEATIRGEPRPNPPKDAKEITAFKVGVETAKKFMARFGKNMEPEKIVFSPYLGVAGCIDLLAWSGLDYVIADWKTNAEIKRENPYQSCAVMGLESLPDCDFTRYGLQLSLYERVLRREAYIPANAKVKRLLIHIAPGSEKPEFIETPDMTRECAEILLDDAMLERSGK